jgi:hypothetical protein
MKPFTGIRGRSRRLGALCLLLALAAPAVAEEGARARVPPVAPLPAFTQECSACHVAFAPALLPAASWQRIMAGLPKHFGTDASLDAASAKSIGDWLASNAGNSGRVREAPPEDRITRAAWFLREHGEVSAATWKLPSVKSPAHCEACHTQATNGDFNEHGIRIPR